MRASSLLPLATLALASGLASAQALHGVAAMQGMPSIAEGYLKATPVPGKPLEQKLDLWMTPLHSQTPYRSYQVEMTKKLHVVIVGSDFKSFQHVHPELTPSGHFTLTQAFPAPGVYQVYADGLPDQSPQHQVFRFELHVGNAATASKPDLKPTPKAVNVGPYEVDLSNLRLHSGRMEMVDINILKNGQPAKDLHPYLGAPAHAIFLNEADLSYVHAHPMSMDQMMMDMSKPMPDLPDTATVASDMMLHLAIREPGTYKLWLQFRGAGNQLYIAEFTVYAS